MTSFSCNNYFTYVLRIIIFDVSETAGEKKREAININNHQKEKK